MNTMHKSIFLTALLLSACGNSQNGSKETSAEENSGTLPNSGLPSKGGSSVNLPADPTEDLAVPLGIKNSSVVGSKKQVIVNAANKWLAPGGGLSGAIFKAADQEKVLAEIAAKHKGVSNASMSGTPLLETSKVFTTGAYNLSDQATDYIIHALGPDFREASYNANFEQGYTDLRTTYKNLYSEMDRLHQAHKVTSMGVIPISSGIFAGKANQKKLFEIMIEETLSAMQRYSYLKPELYLFESSEYETVKKMLPAVVSRLNQSTALSSGVGTSSAKLVLLDSSMYVNNFGSLNVHGAASSWGSMRVMGSSVKGINTQLTQMSVGKIHNAHFLGCEFETAYSLGELTSYSLKAIAVTHITDNIKVSSGFGYMCENMSARLPHNIRHFLNEFGIDFTALKRQGIVGDLSAQYQFQGMSNVSFTADIGLRATYMGALDVNSFAQFSCHASGLGISMMISKAEAGLSVDFER